MRYYTIDMSQFRVFQSLRFMTLRNAASLLVGHSRLRLVTILFASLLIAGIVFAGAFEGFLLLQRQNIPFAGRLVGMLFDFLFLALAVLLVFSGGIILYASLFTSPETAFLLATPARADQVFAYKFQASVAFSSWAFLLMGLPILVAYGLVFGVPLGYYALLPVFFGGFLLIPGSIGAVGCFLVVNVAPQRRKQLLAIGIAVVLMIAAWWTYRTVRETIRTSGATRDTLQWLDRQFAFAGSKLVPSHWMTRGLQASARGDWAEAAYPLTLLWANGLMLYLGASLAARRLYRRGYNRLATGGDLRRRYGGRWLDEALDKSLFFVDRQIRLLIVKDFRTFRREPAQWAQILIFAGLMLLYFVNSPQFYQSDRGRGFQHVIGFTNLLATAMLMCAYMSRFVYPMLSLEGRKFWILGLLPLERERLLRGKFAFAATGSVVIGAALVTISDLLLGMPAIAFALHLPAVVVLALGLSGLSVGLGAALPNFRESDPSKIAVGFGGTMNLIAGLLYLIAVIALMAGPLHLALGLSGDDSLPARTIPFVVTGAIAGIAVGLAGTLIPLRIGTSVLKSMEF